MIVETTPKTPEVLTAQVAAYAAEAVSNGDNQAHLYANLGAIATGEVGDITRVTTKIEREWGGDGKIIRIPEGTTRIVATADDYTGYLNSVGGAKYEGIQERAMLLTAYDSFAPTIARLQSEFTNAAKQGDHAKLLGKGGNSRVVSVDHDSKQYAVRIPYGKEADPATVDGHLGAAVLTKGINHLEQMVAGSYETGVTIAEIMPGKEIGELTVDDVRKVRDSQLDDLVDTLRIAHNRGIEIDSKPSNIFYDPEAGFGIVDLASTKNAGVSHTQTLGGIVGELAADIANASFYRDDRTQKSSEEYADDLKVYEANLDVLRRYRTSVETKLEGQDRIGALAATDKAIASTQETVNNYSDPDWVKSRIETVLREQRERRQNGGKFLIKEDDFVNI